MTRIFHSVAQTVLSYSFGHCHLTPPAATSFCCDKVGNIGSGGHPGPGHIHHGPDVRDGLLQQVHSHDLLHRHRTC